MEGFRRNQEQFRHAVEGAFAGSPFEALAKRNMAMLEAATDAFRPGRGGEARPAAAAPPPAGERDRDGEMAELRAELARLTDRIEQLSR